MIIDLFKSCFSGPISFRIFSAIFLVLMIILAIIWLTWGLRIADARREKEEEKQSPAYGYFGIDLDARDNFKTVTLEPKDKGSIAKLRIPVRNFGPTHISEFNVVALEVTYDHDSVKKTFDLLHTRSAAKNLTINPGQGFIFGFPWIKTNTLKEDFAKILKDRETSFRILVSYITFDNTRWEYEISFSFRRDLSPEKEHSGKWPLIILSQNLSKL